LATAERRHPLEAADDDGGHLNAVDYEKLSRLIGTQIGIKLPPAKRTMVEGRLRRRVRARGFASFDEYCDDLFRRDGAVAELPYLINAVTTNKTDFFREPEHFSFLERQLLPALLAARGDERLPLFKFWSAASSSGAEAYTIAMLLADAVERSRNFRFAVLGTDVSTAVLAQADRAVYPAEMIAPVPPELQLRYIMRPRAPGMRPEVRIVPELRRLVRFGQLNLMDRQYKIDRDVDVIFLRNVLIYFDRADQVQVVNRLIGHLRPGGYLLLGHSESMIGNVVAVRQVAPSIFQKL
jgi:chemotaxis protein methyltransferase CheR